LTGAKLTIFALGGAFGGLAGGLYAHYVLFITPDDFGFAFLISLQLPIVFGGLDRFYGAVAGTILLGFIPEFVRELGQYRLVFIALATLIVLILRPSGLITHTTIATLRQYVRRMTGPLLGRTPKAPGAADGGASV
jgi:branched-chain amino acid transport system permease protein